MSLEFHPLANHFPMLSEDRLSQLTESIKTYGLDNPIVLYEGMILDGRNRYLACQRAGVEPQVRHFDGDDPAAFVWRQNIERRDLTDDQRAAIAVTMKPIIATEAETNRRRKISVSRSETKMNSSSSRTGEPTAKSTRRTLAEEANVSEWKIQQATAVQAAAPPLLKGVQDGTMKLRDAERLAKGPDGAAPRRRTNGTGIRPSSLLPGQQVRQPTPRRSDFAQRLFDFVRRYPNQQDGEAFAREIERATLDLPVDAARAFCQRLQSSAKGRQALLEALKRHISNMEKSTS